MRDKPYKIHITGNAPIADTIRNHLLPGFELVNNVGQADGLIILLSLRDGDSIQTAIKEIKASQAENPNLQVLLLGTHSELLDSHSNFFTSEQKALSRELLGIAVDHNTVHYRRVKDSGTIVNALATFEQKISLAKETPKNMPMAQ